MKKRFSGPQIVAKLRQADVLIGQGKNVPEVCKEIEISQQTYYRWRQKYGGILAKSLRITLGALFFFWMCKEAVSVDGMSFDTLLRACLDNFRTLFLKKWTNPKSRVRNKMRNNGIPHGFYAATKPFRIAS